MRSDFNFEPNYKHLSYPSHTIFLSLQVSPLVSTCLFACMVCNDWGYSAHSHRLPFHRIMNGSFVFYFSSVDPMISIHWDGGKGFGLCLCSPLRGICRGAVEGQGSSAYWRGTQPELSETRGAQENTGPPKQNSFYGNGYIYLHGSQKNHSRMAF